MRLLIFLSLAIATLFGCSSSEPELKTITIAAAANMQFAMDSIVVLFEEEYNINCDVSTNSSGMLTAQIVNGAPYDILFQQTCAIPINWFKVGWPHHHTYMRTGDWSLCILHKKNIRALKRP